MPDRSFFLTVRLISLNLSDEPQTVRLSERRDHADRYRTHYGRAVHPDDFFPPVSPKRSDLVCSWLLFWHAGSGAPAASVDPLIVQDKVGSIAYLRQCSRYSAS